MPAAARTSPLPSVTHIVEFLHSSIGVLAHDVTLDELLEARELLEVPAARLAAGAGPTSDVKRLQEAIPGRPGDLDTAGAVRLQQAASTRS